MRHYVTKKLFELLFLIFFCEIFLYLLNYPDWWKVGALLNQEKYFIFDASRGWVGSPGTYRYSGTAPEREILVNIDQDGARNSGPKKSLTAPNLYLVGDSYVFGYGLSDSESLPWKMQGLLPDYIIHNLGVGGNGTCHVHKQIASLLTQEKNSKRGKRTLSI